MPERASPVNRVNRASVPPEIVAKLRAICSELPETIEEPAWGGTRWRIRKHTFAHVLMIDAGWPPAYAKAAKSEGPLCVMTFRSALPELDVYAYSWAPFFKPGWWPDIVGMALDADTDWDEVDGLVTASYCRLAPKKLADSVRPPKGGSTEKS
jgi:hypothetical protein